MAPHKCSINVYVGTATVMLGYEEGDAPGGRGRGFPCSNTIKKEEPPSKS